MEAAFALGFGMIGAIARSIAHVSDTTRRGHCSCFVFERSAQMLTILKEKLTHCYEGIWGSGCIALPFLIIALD
jgi:isopentenyldiphosphate isomerase